MKNIWKWIKNNPNRAMFLVPILLVAAISISHVVSFYDMANPHNWAIYLSIAIEVGAITALVAATNKIKGGIWFMFGIVTFIQMLGNIFYSYKEIDEAGNLFKSWVELTGPVWELFGTEQTDIIGLKRWLAFLAGGLLPIISLTSLHFFVKYEKPEEDSNNEEDGDDGDDGDDDDSEKGEVLLEVAEEPTKVVEEAIEEPKKVVEEPKEVIEEPKEVVEEAVEEPKEVVEEPKEVVEEKVTENSKKESFDTFVEKKKKKLEEDKKIFKPLLDILYMSGDVEKGDVLPTYIDFREKVDLNFTDDNIKMFLTLCNYLEITELSDNVRKAKVDYGAASTIIDKYLSLEDNSENKVKNNKSGAGKDWWIKS